MRIKVSEESSSCASRRVEIDVPRDPALRDPDVLRAMIHADSYDGKPFGLGRLSLRIEGRPPLTRSEWEAYKVAIDRAWEAYADRFGADE